MPDAPPSAGPIRLSRAAALAEQAVTEYCRAHPGPSADWTAAERAELDRLRRELANTNAALRQTRIGGAAPTEPTAERQPTAA